MKAFASAAYASGLIDTEAKATPEDRWRSITVARTGSAHGVSPGSRGGNASKATRPIAGSLASAVSAPMNMSVSTAACPVTSSGLFCEANDGSARRSARFVGAANAGSVSPAVPAASANSVHAPPDWKAPAIPSVRSFRWCASRTAASNIVTGSSTRTTAVTLEPGVA